MGRLRPVRLEMTYVRYRDPHLLSTAMIRDDRLSPWVMSDPVNYELMGRLGPVRLEMTYVC